MQSSLDDFLARKGDLEAVLRTIGAREDWESFHRAGELYAKETGSYISWHPGGYRNTIDMLIDGADHRREDSVKFRMGDGGWRGIRGVSGFIHIEAEGGCQTSVSMTIGRDVRIMPGREGKRRMQVHHRFFEILAEQVGIEYTGAGASRHVRWDGSEWGLTA